MVELLSMYPAELIMDLPVSTLQGYIKHAIEKEKDNAAWDIWCSLYPHMSMGLIKGMKYNEFKDKLFEKQYQYTEKTSEEIIDEIEALIKRRR